jgi:hypothetical protein
MSLTRSRPLFAVEPSPGSFAPWIARTWARVANVRTSRAPAASPAYARVLGAALALASALASSSCFSGPADVDAYRCDGPAPSCPAGRTCVQISTGEHFCVLAGADGGTGTDADAGCACDDGNPCNGQETCDVAGACSPGTPVDCTAMDADCVVGACVAADGTCATTPRPDGTACDDGLLCTVADFCSGGTCTGLPACGLTGCEEGCDEAAGGTCGGTPPPDGTPCSSGTFCATGETCLAGACAGGAPRDCDASAADQCNMGTCNEANRLCEPVPVNNGTPCDDGDPATSGDVCTFGGCAGT